jgi:hypothetical protein
VVSYENADELWFELIGMVPVILRREADYEALLLLLSRHWRDRTTAHLHSDFVTILQLRDDEVQWNLWALFRIETDPWLWLEGTENAPKLSITLWNGSRVTKHFSKDDDIREVYDFVAVFDLIWHRPEILKSVHQPDSELRAEPREGYEHEYHSVLRHFTATAPEILGFRREVGEHIDVYLAKVQIAVFQRENEDQPTKGHTVLLLRKLLQPKAAQVFIRRSTIYGGQLLSSIKTSDTKLRKKLLYMREGRLKQLPELSAPTQ